MIESEIFLLFFWAAVGFLDELQEKGELMLMEFSTDLNFQIPISINLLKSVVFLRLTLGNPTLELIKIDIILILLRQDNIELVDRMLSSEIIIDRLHLLF